MGDQSIKKLLFENCIDISFSIKHVIITIVIFSICCIGITTKRKKLRWDYIFTCIQYLLSVLFKLWYMLGYTTKPIFLREWKQKRKIFKTRFLYKKVLKNKHQWRWNIIKERKKKEILLPPSSYKIYGMDMENYFKSALIHRFYII